MSVLKYFSIEILAVLVLTKTSISTLNGVFKD